MNANRRFVLKSLALSGLAGWAMGRPVRALAGTSVAPAAVAKPVLALVNPGAASIGYLLASLGTRTAMMAPSAFAANTPVTGSFVSFSIEA